MKKYIITEEQLLEALLSNVRETRIESFEVSVNEMRNDFGSVVHTIKDTSLEELSAYQKRRSSEKKMSKALFAIKDIDSKPQQSMSRAVKDRFSELESRVKSLEDSRPHKIMKFYSLESATEFTRLLDNKDDWSLNEIRDSDGSTYEVKYK